MRRKDSAAARIFKTMPVLSSSQVTAQYISDMRIDFVRGALHGHIERGKMLHEFGMVLEGLQISYVFLYSELFW